jgi:hypothetical protein
MSLAKTEKARLALQSRSADLGPRERQLLILCDGRRKPGELLPLLGLDAQSLLERLLRDGYVVRLDGMPAGPERVSATGTFRVPAPAAPIVVPAAATPARTRRSVAATKMYMIDMLQLLRDMDASSIAVSIQTSADEDELVAHVLGALRYIRRKSGPSYARRIAERLAEMLPEAYLPALAALVDQFEPAQPAGA